MRIDRPAPGSHQPMSTPVPDNEAWLLKDKTRTPWNKGS
jgi:hypothetical protein